MSEIKTSGKVIKVLPIQQGESAKGTWKKQEFVIETDGQYPKQICFTACGDRTQNVGELQIGQSVTVHFNPQSKEFNERWYTELQAWKIES